MFICHFIKWQFVCINYHKVTGVRAKDYQPNHIVNHIIISLYYAEMNYVYDLLECFTHRLLGDWAPGGGGARRSTPASRRRSLLIEFKSEDNQHRWLHWWAVAHIVLLLLVLLLEIVLILLLHEIVLLLLLQGDRSTIAPILLLLLQEIVLLSTATVRYCCLCRRSSYRTTATANTPSAVPSYLMQLPGCETSSDVCGKE